MDMSVMAPFMGPGLGGIMAGTEQRQIEDKRFTDVQRTLQEIAASQGQEGERAALLPGKLAAQQNEQAMAPLARQEVEGRIKAASAKEKAEDMNKYIDAQVKSGDMPGGQDAIYQTFPQYKDHPISKEAQRILMMSKTDPEGAKEEWKNLREKISTSAATIEKRQQEEAAAKRAREAQDAAQTRVETQEAGRTQRLIMATQAKQELAETAAAAKAAGVNLSQDKYLVNLQQRLSEAELKGDVEEMGRIKSQLQQAKSIMMEINTAVNTEKGQNAVLRARALGITLPDYAPVAKPQTPAPTTTTPQNVGPASRTSPGGRGATVGPAPVKTSEAPAASPGPIAQTADRLAAAVLPSANAAPPQPDSAALEQVMNINRGMPAMPPPQGGPIAGQSMMQPVNAGPAPTVRAPANINFAATDIGPSGRFGVLQQEWKDLQSDITKAQNRLNVARRGGDREYIEQLEQNLRALERNLPMLAREIQSMSRGK